MAFRLTIVRDRVSADLTVMPLIMATEYRPLISVTQGAELAPQAGDPHGADLVGKLSGLRNGQFLALFADGSVSTISARAAMPAINALFTRDGGEAAGFGSSPSDAPATEAEPAEEVSAEPAQEMPRREAMMPAERESPVRDRTAQPPPPDRYTLPEGGPAALAQFLTGLRNFPPQTPEQSAEHRQEFANAVRAAAEKILEMKTDLSSDAYQRATFVLLEGRVRMIRAAEPAAQRRLVEEVKEHLAARGTEELPGEVLSLAFTTGRMLEAGNQIELAVQAHRDLAEVLSGSQQDPARDVARRNELLEPADDQVEGEPPGAKAPADTPPAPPQAE